MSYPTREQAASSVMADPSVDEVVLHEPTCAMRVESGYDVCTCTPSYVRRDSMGRWRWHGLHDPL